MNEFLRKRSQIDEATKWLKDNGYTSHPISCKDWELKHVVENLTDGDLLDAGADGSFVLHNAIKKGISGIKYGIDLAEVTGDNKADGATYIVGSLMDTSFENEKFDTIVCMSVIEHQVDYSAFAKEMSRLLKNKGRLIVSFDYSPVPVDTSLTKLYSLDWNILSKENVKQLVDILAEYKMVLSGGSIDWHTEDMVINPSYCSPANVAYTFGIFKFEKL